MGVQLLGHVVVDGDASLRPRDRTALAALAVRRRHVVAADQLADAMWGEHPPPSWPKQVQICIARLRKALGATAIETTAGGYRLALSADDLDVDRFEQLVERGRQFAATDEPDRAASTFGRALALWRGTPFENVSEWAPGRSETVRLEELRRTAEEEMLDARLASGQHRDVAIEAEALAAEEPLRERRWAILALAQYRSGRQADALRSLNRARRTLVDQLGVAPGTELTALEASILRHDPSLAGAPAPAAVSDSCPYKGLAHYDVADADSFFGREAEIAACLARLDATSLLVVAGPSGCGKSSLVRAGLVPALRARHRSIAVFVPGTDPDASFDDAVAGPEGTSLLVIDQFEEVFAREAPADAVRSFLARVAAHAIDSTPVVLAVRIDHLAGLALDPALGRLVEQGLVLLGAPAGSELREAIEAPARQAGLRLEQGLVDLLVRETEGGPGTLPLLSHALAETWQRRDGAVLTVEAYLASGGIRGAVARSAERLHESLAPDARATLRSLLLRLIAPALNGDPVRCRVPSRQLLGDPTRERVLSLLVRARLVTAGEDSFEIAHEALARAWPRLWGWLEDDAAGHRILGHLSGAAAGWDALGRPESELYRGARLAAAAEWRAASHPDLTELERTFLDESTDRAATESDALLERARRDTRQNRRLRTLVTTTAALLVAALVAGAVALISRGDAREQRDAARTAQGIAEREGRVATARELAAEAVANIPVDAERSVLLALAAVDETRSADGDVLKEAEEALHLAIAASRIEVRVPGAGGRVDWSPRGDLIVAEGATGAGRVDLRDARTGDPVLTLAGHDGDVTDVAFDPTGTRVATTGDDGAARVWDTSTGELVHTLESPGRTPALGVSFAQGAALLAAAWPAEGLVRVLDVTTGVVIREITIPAPGDTSFDPSGEKIAISSMSEPLAVVHDVAEGGRELTLEGHLHPLEAVEWSPDGESIATGSLDGSARVFDAATGAQRFALLAHGSHVFGLDWSPDGTQLVTASADGTAKLWLMIEGDGRELASLSAHDTRKGLVGVAFSPDGTRVLTGDESATSASIWDVGVTAGAEIARLPAVSFFFSVVAFGPDGRSLFTTAGGGTTEVWDADTFERVRTLGGPARTSPRTLGELPIGGDDVCCIDVSGDGRLVATARELDRELGVVTVWDLIDGRRQLTVEAGFGVAGFAWSPDGELLAIAGGGDRGGSLLVVDRDGQEIARRDVPGAFVNSVTFDTRTGGLLIAMESSEPDQTPRVEVWDWRSERVSLTIATAAGLAIASSTGELIATAPHFMSPSQQVGIYDAADGRLLMTLGGHTGTIHDLAFSADGTRLASASADGTTRVWDTGTGDELLVLRDGVGALVSSVAFSPDGSRLATAGADGTVRVWALDLDQLIAIAERALTRTFTDDECGQYRRANKCAPG